MNADGTNPINLTNHPAEDNHSSWAPDGTRIAFDSNRDGDGNLEIYVMNADGANPINITNAPDVLDLNPSWGPVPALSVTSKGKLATLWGRVKRAR
jgi:TolB protein